MDIKIILSTTREGKASDRVGAWAKKELERIDSGNSYEIIDLSVVNLPFFDEPKSPRNRSYSFEHTKKWSDVIDNSDGFIIVLAEYNGSFPAPIKNAIDFLYWEWVGKPVGFIGYGGSGAQNSINQLSFILNRLKMNVLEQKILISKVWNAFDESGNIDSDLVEGSFKEFSKELNEKLDD